MSALIEVLKDKDKDVRVSTAKALGTIGDKSALPALIAALKDKDWFVRNKAAEVLMKIKDIKAVTALIEELKNKYEDGRKSVAEVLDKLEWKPSTQKEKINYLIATHKWEELIKIGKPAVSALIQRLNDEKTYIIQEVSTALYEIINKQLIQDLNYMKKYLGIIKTSKASNILTNRSGRLEMEYVLLGDEDIEYILLNLEKGQSIKSSIYSLQKSSRKISRKICFRV